MRRSDDTSNSFVTTAEQAVANNNNSTATTTSTTMCVLNGEERREMFCVPTCEHGKPCPVALWIDADRRTVRVQRRDYHPVHIHRSSLSSSSSSEDRRSPDSVMASGSSTTTVSESELRQSLRGTTLKPKNAVDRVIQAVLMKWRVVEHSSSS